MRDFYGIRFDPSDWKDAPTDACSLDNYRRRILSTVAREFSLYTKLDGSRIAPKRPLTLVLPYTLPKDLEVVMIDPQHEGIEARVTFFRFNGVFVRSEAKYQSSTKRTSYHGGVIAVYPEANEESRWIIKVIKRTLKNRLMTLNDLREKRKESWEPQITVTHNIF